jgi:hypothetical protein
MPAPRQRQQRANDRHQGDHRQRRETHPDHLRRRTEQPDATANIDRHDHPVSMLVAGVRWGGGTSVRTSTCRRHHHGYRHQPSHVCRTSAVQEGDRCGSSGRSIRRSPPRYNFLYPSFMAGPAGGRRPPSARQRHDGHRGAGLTLVSLTYQNLPRSRRRSPGRAAAASRPPHDHREPRTDPRSTSFARRRRSWLSRP